jgi:hypothetical protein
MPLEELVDDAVEPDRLGDELDRVGPAARQPLDDRRMVVRIGGQSAERESRGRRRRSR